MKAALVVLYLLHAFATWMIATPLENKFKTAVSNLNVTSSRCFLTLLTPVS